MTTAVEENAPMAAATALPSFVLAARAIASYPGPAAVMRADGVIIAANAQADSLCVALADGLLGLLSAPLASALAGGRSITELISLPAEGGPQLLDCVFLPIEPQAVLILGKNVALETNLRAALVESRQRYKDLVEISSDFAWEVGADGRFAFVSPRGAVGHAADALIGHEPEEFLLGPPGGPPSSPFHTGETVEEMEFWMRRADGGEACLVAAAAPLLGRNGEWRGARGVCREVTYERARDAALARASNRERLLTYILRAIRDVVDPVEALRAAAEAATRALGATGCQVYRRGEAGEFVAAASHGGVGDATAALAALAQGDDHESAGAGWQVLAAATRYGSAINGAVCVWRCAEALPWGDDERLLIADVANQLGIANEQVANHERILTLSRTDALTGLFNRRAFFEDLGRRFARLARDGKPAALIYVDLDNFKLVNDAHGHQRGDEALIAVRDLLLNHIRPSDLVARLGGDEFAFWLEGAEETIALRRAAELVAGAVALEQFSGDPRQPLHLSLGVAVYHPARPESLDDLVARADKAMYRVKHEGKGGWRLAAPAGESEA